MLADVDAGQWGTVVEVDSDGDIKAPLLAEACSRPVTCDAGSDCGIRRFARESLIVPNSCRRCFSTDKTRLLDAFMFLSCCSFQLPRLS